ncbi:MAG: nuclear transport factor 2 family protein [Bauldia sp.]|nr:nuclear transport factor 2 family protein [Bauldia sp.]
MRKHLAVAVAGLCALFVALAPARAADTDIVRAFYAAINAQDIDKAMSFIAPDAAFANAMGTFTGEAEIRGYLKSVVADGIAFLVTGFREVGGRVGWDYELLKGGSDIVGDGEDGVTIVKDGRIVFDGTEATAPK